MGVNVWAQVGGVAGYLPLSALTGLSGQLLGMNLAATLAEWKAATFLANQLAVPVGSAASPSYTFTGELGTGFYKSAAGKLAFSVLGTKYLEIDNGTASLYMTAHQRFVSKVLMEAKSADIVAAANIDLGTATGNYVYITNAAGDTTITRLGGTANLQSGTEMELKFKITGGSVTLKHDVNFLNLPGGSDLKLGDGDICRFRKTNSADQFWDLTSYSKFQSLSITAAAQQPVTFIYPDITDRPAMTAGGWLPWNLNQQWGGAGCMPFHMVDSATGVEYKFDAADAYIEMDNLGASIGNVVAQYYIYQSIHPGKNIGLQAIWVRVNKTGNPVDNLTLSLWSSTGTAPNVLIAAANVINGKQITSDTTGNWYRFSFAVVQNLIAGTEYMITLHKSAGVDAANFYGWGYKATTKYPNNKEGTGTIAPVFTPSTGTLSFICEAQTSDQPIQSAGTFDGKIVGTEGNPLNRSVAFCNFIRNTLPITNPQGWSILLRGKTWTKDKTIAEFMYGLHHDRLNIRAAAGTGFVTVTLYESDNTVNTLVGNSDVSAATYKDVLITGRSMNDGADYLRIYTGIGGTWQKENEAIAQSYLFDPLMLRLGTAWILGGFPLFKAADYTQLMDMSVLPSAAGWTFTTTTATAEGNVFAVAGNKLNQIKAGMAVGGNGFYEKNALALSNANGWAINSKLRITNTTNTKDEQASFINIEDGTKQVTNKLQEYYSIVSGAIAYYPQLDNKSADTTFFQSGKGSDNLTFQNGRLTVDGTSNMTTASANNKIDFGDGSTTANENADVIWDYFGYYNTANIYPQFTSGELHEFAIFPGEQGTLGQALYNSGVPISVKQYCGIGKNWVGEQVPQLISVAGITGNAATASATPVLNPEMESFVVAGSIPRIANQALSSNNSAGGITYIIPAVDGISVNNSIQGSSNCGAANSQIATISTAGFPKISFGLHKIEGRWQCNAGNSASVGANRRLEIEAKAY